MITIHLFSALNPYGIKKRERRIVAEIVIDPGLKTVR